MEALVEKLCHRFSGVTGILSYHCITGLLHMNYNIIVIVHLFLYLFSMDYIYNADMLDVVVLFSWLYGTSMPSFNIFTFRFDS